MSLLLNRKYGSRLECLYYILQSCYKKNGKNSEFQLKDLKFDPDDENNVHHFCKQLISIVGRECCPYLNNKLDLSKCYATQSVDSDSTKSKAVSDIGGSLEALGFISKNINVRPNRYKITDSGEKWVKSEFSSLEWEKLALEGVLSYGVFIGFLSKLIEQDDIFSYSGLYVSYPQTTENVEYTDAQGNIKYINISTDSQRDSNTRTTTRLINWSVSVGLLEPIGAECVESDIAHIKYQKFINAPELTIRRFKKTELFIQLFNKKLYVANPLAYSRLHKNVASLRENGGEDLRNATLLYNENILNRRFVFVYVLNYFSKNDKELCFPKLIEIMKKYGEKFFTDISNANNIMETESEIADIVGIPFIVKDDMLIARTTINETILTEDAPSNIVSLAKTIIEEMQR